MTSTASPAAPEGDAAGPGTARASQSLFARFGDWLNPVLVKEIRQAQRGKVFSISLVVTVLLALFACMMMALEINTSSGQQGREFFTLVYVFLCVAVLLIVPFQAFNAMGSEWDDHTFEMLLLSNLKPRQIVLGKILSAFVQAMLFFAAFLPFIAVAFLLRGVDVVVLAVVLGLTAFASLWFTTISVMFSTLTRNRFVRVLMMVILAGNLVGVISGAAAFASELMRRPDQIVDADFWIFLPQVLAIATFNGLMAFFISCNLLAHEEENRSTNVRALISGGALIFLAIMVINVTVPRSPMPREPLFALTIGAIAALALAAIFLCTEPETLGRRVAPTVPKSRGLALLTLPWFPGRGRGVVFLLLHLGLLAVGAFALAPFADSTFWGTSSTSRRSIMQAGGLSILVAIAYALLYTLVPIGLFLLVLAKTKKGRNATRALTLFSPLFFALAPAALGLMFGFSSHDHWDHAGNGPIMIGESFDGRLHESVGFLLFVIPAVMFGLALALPAVLRALRETAECSRGKRTVRSPEPIAPETSGS